MNASLVSEPGGDVNLRCPSSLDLTLSWHQAPQSDVATSFSKSLARKSLSPSLCRVWDARSDVMVTSPALLDGVVKAGCRRG